jgi:hypothetical protein
MKKSSKPQSMLKYLLIAVLVLQTVAIGYLFTHVKSMNDSLAETTDKVLLLSGTVQDNYTTQSPAIMPRENLVAFSDLGFAIPYNEITKSLRYNSYNGIDTYVSSTQVIDTKARQISCTELVRINTESDEKYSPWEESAVSVKLSNGKTIHIFAAKAFANDEASTMGCGEEVWGILSPKMVAAEFQNAQAL